MSVTLRQLRAFCVVYELKNFTRAAEALNLTQSTISKLCSELEKELGMDLFERSARGVKLLDGTEDLYSHAQKVFGLLRAASRNLESRAGLERGEVAVAASPIMMRTLVAPVVTAFHRRYPGIVFDLHELTGDEVVEYVLDSRADLGLVSVETRDSRLSSRVVHRGAMFAVVPPDHELADVREVSLRELANYSHIVLRGAYTVRRKIDQLLMNQGLSFRKIAQTGSLTTAFAMIRDGMGITVMPGYIRGVCDEMGLKAVPIADKSVALHELSILLRDRYPVSPAAAAFLSMFEEQLADMSHSARITD